MALYLGSNKKYKIALDGTTYIINIICEKPVINGVLLKTSEGYIWKDSNGLYLKAKESD